MNYRKVGVGIVLLVAACTRAPLTDPHIVLRGATRGDVPRDANGEPVFDRVKPVPSNALLPPAPPPPR
jgi:hypothetical protein